MAQNGWTPVDESTSAWKAIDDPVDELTKKTQAAARGAGVKTVSAPPLQRPMESAGSSYLSTLDPQARYLQEHPEARDRMESGTSMAVPETLLGLGAMGPSAMIKSGGLARTAGTVARGTVGAVGGAALGGYGGGMLGNIVGHKEVGSQIGATLGGLAGGFTGARTAPEVPEAIDPVAAAVKNRTASWIPTKIKPEIAPAELDPVAAAVKNRTANWIPTKIKPEAAGTSVDPNTFTETPNAEGTPSTVAKTKDRLVLSPEEARTRDRMAPIWKQRASERGMIFAGGGVPEEGRSVPRLPIKTSIEEYGGPRLAKPDLGVTPDATTPTQQGVVSTTARPGPATLSTESGARITAPKESYTGPERRGSIREISGADPMRQARMNQLRQTMSDKTVDVLDRAVAESQLNDLKANPFEQNQLGSLESMKKQQPTMTRAEAEAETAKRMTGRNKRFEGQ